MSRLDQEWQIKLRLMDAIVTSQEALANILQNVAKVTDYAGVSAVTLQEHVRVITNMQGALLKMVVGKSWRPAAVGAATSPWLSKEVFRIEAEATKDSCSETKP
ncbi:MAG: hypothetical protein P0Y55_12220 [Candidatus Cohnella colombiensis]|uniref:Uncharacterized protein n=1 Tax=Candidatus Cohnella colombiensis TaxID=3121368 RepID=A0AA95JEK4_9BACL|nr:MAG: hypothetical protein P0Y55_12220 [Cohnella sp.]